jgi:hypothetical protein
MKSVCLGRECCAIVILLFLAVLPGCSWLTRPMEKPVIEDNLRRSSFDGSRLGVLSLNPERRAVLYHFETKRFCSENPTEVGIDMASASRLAADLKQTGTSLLDAQMALSAASNNYVLNRRSPGIILYQSSSYQFCQMYANGAITAQELIELQTAALDTAEKIVLAETTAIKEIRVEEEKRKTAEERRKEEEEKTEAQMEKNKKAEADKKAQAAPVASPAGATTVTTTRTQ